MQPSDLELYTTSQLIDELIRRKTFLGVVVHADEDLKVPHWRGERVFKIHFNSNLQAGEVGRLLGVLGEGVLGREG